MNIFLMLILGIPVFVVAAFFANEKLVKSDNKQLTLRAAIFMTAALYGTFMFFIIYNGVLWKLIEK